MTTQQRVLSTPHKTIFSSNLILPEGTYTFQLQDTLRPSDTTIEAIDNKYFAFRKRVSDLLKKININCNQLEFVSFESTKTPTLTSYSRYHRVPESLVPQVRQELTNFITYYPELIAFNPSI